MKLIPTDQKLRFVEASFTRLANGGFYAELRNDEYGLTIIRARLPGGAEIRARLIVDGLAGDFTSTAAANMAIRAALAVPPSVAEWPVDANGAPVEDAA